MDSPVAPPQLRLLVLAGDGIGAEVSAAALRILAMVCSGAGIDLQVEHDLIGGASVDVHGTAVTGDVLERAASADAVFVGAVGGPRWAGRSGEERPGSGLLRLRRHLGVALNLRPVRAHRALLDSVAVRSEVARTCDLLIVRELLGGAYYGPQHRDAEEARDTTVYRAGQVHAVIEAAIGFARGRRGRVTSVDKTGVMATGTLWREVATACAAGSPDVEVEHALVDSFALRLVSAPGDLDVVVTENLFGDILSDLAAVHAGSLGLLGSASLNPHGGTALYEPVHGSAPQLAGRGIANPLGAIESVALLCEHSLQRTDLAATIRSAMDTALSAGHRTPDIGGQTGTEELTSAVVQALSRPLVAA